MAQEPDEARGHEFTASLRVSSQEFWLAELVERLGQPSSGTDKGNPVSSRRPESGRRRHSMWLLESNLDRTSPLDEHIEKLVTFVESHRQVIDSLRDQCVIDIFCGLFTDDGAQGGFTIEPELSARLADLGLPVGIDIY